MKFKKRLLLAMSMLPLISHAEQLEIDFFLDKNPEFYELNYFVDSLTSFDKIICGRRHCYGTKSGLLYTAGYNERGQLGLGTVDKDIHTWKEVENIKDVKQVEAFSDYGILTTKSAQIFAVGNARSGMIGLPEKKSYPLFTEVKIKGFYAFDIEIIMSERTTFIKDKEKNKYFASGSAYDKKGAFAMFDKSTRMEFIPVDLETANDQMVFLKDDDEK